MVIRIAKLGEAVLEVEAENGDSIRTILANAEIATAGFEIRLDGNAVGDLDRTVADGNVITLVPEIKGG